MTRSEWLRMMAMAAMGTAAAPGRAMARWLQQTPAVPFTRADFGPDFKWGVATAATQIEGAWNRDGKGESIWDRFAHRRGSIKNGDVPDVSCNFYDLYAQDLQLLRQLNMGVFRYSVSWPRVLPQGTGPHNPKGLDFYERVTDACLQLGIEPWVTLYHWDLPQVLEDRGGWANRDVLGWFEEYADLVSRRLADRVKHWMVFNEPAAFTGVGYLLGMHAPGHKSLGKFTRAVHHANLCQGVGGRVLRANVPGAQVGTTLSASPVEAWRPDNPRDHRSVQRMDALLNRLFAEPILGLGYPEEAFPAVVGRVMRHQQPGDAEKLPFAFDFLGLQVYFRFVAKHSLFPPFLWTKQIQPEDMPHKPEVTSMGWEVHPEAIYRVLKRYSQYPNVPPLVVTENGAAFPDTVENGRVHDEARTRFLQAYLGQVLRAKREGVNVNGYLVWTLLDNFEWAEGYAPRFGLVHVDFATQQRTLKDSGRWFQQFLAP